MEIKVLGPLEATLAGASITPTASKPRQLLALLGLQAGNVVTVPALIEELWGSAPPRSALTTLQTYVLQIRRRVEAASAHPAAKDVLVTRYGGYLLAVDRDGVDATAFDRAARAGQEALEAGRLEQASALFTSALRVWRGPVLADVKVGPRLGMEVARLREGRLGVQEARIDVELRLGRHQALLGELSVLTAQHPMHENFRAQHMLALYRSGRRWRALEEYRSLHDKLIEELGLGPSERLRGLQRAILSADSVLDVADRDAPGRGARPQLAS
ncbi:AfsR/SARP family transcriptional regulator [Actinokineospora pegani]|uniref:AfsR/SARP family transcriptional regulator n=1 Tax=Actinokineospora pegani TaxID=2654637 RepID=UPI0012EA8473|nr:AfsR/SARP family transcriptional regulator [Actinokineospora pegani]